MDNMSEWIGAISTAFSAIIVTISLWFLWLQVKELRISIQHASAQNVYQTLIEIDRFFVDNPLLRAYFYSNKNLEDDLDEMQKEKVLATAEMLVDCFDNIYQQKSYLSENVLEAYKGFVRDAYKHSPVLRDYLAQRRRWYPKEFIWLFEGLK